MHCKGAKLTDACSSSLKRAVVVRAINLSQVVLQPYKGHCVVFPVSHPEGCLFIISNSMASKGDCRINYSRKEKKFPKCFFPPQVSLTPQVLRSLSSVYSLLLWSRGWFFFNSMGSFLWIIGASLTMSPEIYRISQPSKTSYVSSQIVVKVLRDI